MRDQAIFISGTFDVKNYGDLLFPIIAEKRLNPEGYRVVAASPTGNVPSWADAVPSLRIDSIECLAGPAAGMLIGGGNIIHAREANLHEYEAAGVNRQAYASLWIGATALAAIHDVPIAWNAPGVPKPMTALPPMLLAATLGAASYVSLRDREALALLGLGADEAVVCPDTAVEIAGVWPRRGLEQEFKSLLGRNGAVSSESHFAVIHVKRRSIEGALESLAHRIDEFSTVNGLVPILVAVGPCHGDDSVAFELGKLLTVPKVVLDQPSGLREIAAAIAFSELYVGASLHGYITAFAYGTPGLIVARPNLSKHGGFLEHVHRSDDLAFDWQSALGRAADQINCTRREALPADIQGRLDAHWNRVADAMRHPAANRVGRAWFLQTLFRVGIAGTGWEWALAPVLAPVSATDSGRICR
jgi:hypothetical protein